MTFTIPPQESALLNLQCAQYALNAQRRVAIEIEKRAFFVMRHATSGYLQYTYATPKGVPTQFWDINNPRAVRHVKRFGATYQGRRVEGGITKEADVRKAITMRAKAAEWSRAFIRAGWLGGMKALADRSNGRLVLKRPERAKHLGVAQNYGGAFATAGERPMVEFWNSTGSYRPKVARRISGQGMTHDAAALKHGAPGLARAMRHEEANLAKRIDEKLNGIARTPGKAGFAR